MRKAFLIIVCFCSTILLQAQVSKTVNITAGGLALALTTTEKSTITNLTVKGTINSQDFSTMRLNMHALIAIDLTDVTIVASGTYSKNEVPQWAFYMTGLTSVTLPSSVTSIGANAFQNCSGLTSFTIPSLVTNISEAAFYGCSSLTSITIPSSVKYIGISAFENCSGLTSVTIPSSITSIEYKTFFGCSKLISVTIPSSVTKIGSHTFNRCSGLTSIIIPSSVTSIGDYAFYGCNSLATVSIPSSVYALGEGAFQDCSSLSSIFVYRSNPVVLSSSSLVFKGVHYSTCILYVPVGSKNAYLSANQWNIFSNIVEFSTTDIELINTDDICLYPNPVTDGFHVKGITGKSLISLSDINGKLLLTKVINSNEYFSLSSLPQGVYFVKVTSAGSTLEQKVVKR